VDHATSPDGMEEAAEVTSTIRRRRLCGSSLTEIDL
jgi:hypothetical protein